MHISQRKYRPDIDGLRAIAVLAVILYHAFPSWMPGGFIGVDIFFVISGYLISMIICNELNEGNFKFFEFYARRIVRIFPALILVLVSCFLFGWLALFPNEFKQLGKHIIGGAFFASNFITWSESGYFDNEAGTKPLLHLWSLGIEEQYYFIWPLILWICYKRRLNLLAIGILLALASFYLNNIYIKVDAVAAFYSPLTRFWELMVGSFFALAKYSNINLSTNKNDEDIRKRSRLTFIYKYKIATTDILSLISVFGFLLIAYGLWLINKDTPFPGNWAVIPVLGSALLIYAGPNALVNRTVLSNPIAIWLGLISYPLYLWHWPLLSFAKIIQNETPSRELRVGIILLSIVLAWLTYKFIERPSRLVSNNKLKASIFITAIITLGYAGYKTFEFEGLPNRKSVSSVSSIVRLEMDNPELNRACLAYYGIARNIRYCRLSIYENNKPRIALIGDSHAAALFSGLSKELLNVKEGLLLIGGRLFINVATYPEGDHKQTEIDVYKGGIFATNFVANQSEINTVIMVSRGAGYIKSEDNFYLIDEPKIKDRMKIFEFGMRKTLDTMLANNKKIIFVMDNPDQIGFNPNKCLDKRPLFTNKDFDCSIPREKFDLRQKEYRELVLQVLKDYPTIDLFDQAAYLCDGSFCKFKYKSEVLYGDEDHLSEAGSTFMARKLINLINKSSYKDVH